jgi:succinate dehydrogenase hydrophobic membrane anchor protein
MSGNATDHKITHNLTTLANIPLVAWLICTVLAVGGAGYEGLANWMQHPVNIVAAILFVVVTLKHFTLEIEVVLEDYISRVGLRNTIIYTLKGFWLVLSVTAIISILKIAL